MAYTVHQAKTNLSRILRQVEAGEEVIVMRGKKPVAKITAVEPAAPARRVIGGYEGLVQADDRAFDPMTDEELIECGWGYMVGAELVKPPDQKDPAKLDKTG